jgi:UDP-N-acetylglucosamine 3-dehydrogenase
LTPLRAGIVGLGVMGRNHARVLGAMPGVTLVGAVDSSPAARAAAACMVTADLDELLALGIDICVVAVPTLCHAGIGLELARAGVHTLIEKPLAASVPDGRRLADAFEAAGLVGCAGHVERYNPMLRELHGLVRDGALGRLFQIATSRQGPYPDRIRDVGVVLDLASHDIDLTRWIAGSPYLQVSAYTTRSMTRQHEDLAAVAGLLLDGTVVSHLVNWLSPLKERVVTVTGEGGCLRADLLRTELLFQPHGRATAGGPMAGQAGGAAEELRQRPAGWREPLRAELENFRDAVLGRPADIVTMRQGTEVLEVAVAMLTAVPGTRAAVRAPRQIGPATTDGSAAAAAAAGIPLDALVPTASSWPAR